MQVSAVSDDDWAAYNHRGAVSLQRQLHGVRPPTGQGLITEVLTTDPNCRAPV
jgi:hypothetical protein